MRGILGRAGDRWRFLCGQRPGLPPRSLSQITWNGRPLYLFSKEALAPTSNGGAAPVGNGNGIKAFGGTFSLVFNP